MLVELDCTYCLIATWSPAFSVTMRNISVQLVNATFITKCVVYMNSTTVYQAKIEKSHNVDRCTKFTNGSSDL